MIATVLQYIHNVFYRLYYSGFPSAAGGGGDWGLVSLVRFPL